MTETYRPHNRSTEPLEPIELLPNFLDVVRSELTGQRTIMDRHDRPHHTKFIADIVACCKPANALEIQLAQSIATGYWRLNRAVGLEEGIFALCHPNPTADFGDMSIDHQIANSQTNAFLAKQADFKFLSQYEMRIQRTLNGNKAELKQLQAERPKLDPKPDRPPDKDGFGFSNPQNPPAGTATPEPATPEETKVRTATAQSRSAEYSEPTPAIPGSQRTINGHGFGFSKPPSNETAPPTRSNALPPIR